MIKKNDKKKDKINDKINEMFIAVTPTTPSNENGSSARAPLSSSTAGLVRSNSTISTATANSKIENIKNWSISTYKCTKQLLSEKLGKSSRTVDTGEKYFSNHSNLKPSRLECYFF